MNGDEAITDISEFDSLKLMGQAKILFDMAPDAMKEAEGLKGKNPDLDEMVDRVKKELMRINASEEPGPHSKLLMPTFADLVQKVKAGDMEDLQPVEGQVEDGAKDSGPEEQPIKLVEEKPAYINEPQRYPSPDGD